MYIGICIYLYMYVWIECGHALYTVFSLLAYKNVFQLSLIYIAVKKNEL